MTNHSKYSRKSNLLQDPVGQTIYRTSVPTTIGAIAIILYYLADTYFVGLLGTDELAALGFTFPATILVTYFGVGLAIGTSALVAKAMGKKINSLAVQLTQASMLMALLMGLAFILPGLWATNLLFPAMGAEPDLVILISDFMSIWYFGVPFMLIQFAGTAVIRASGNAKLHGIIMTAGAALNAILDPMLIFGFGPIPALGIAGAALATVITWGLTIVFICYYLTYKEKLLNFTWPGLTPLLNTWRKLLSITLPAALANMITPVATGVITATLAQYGSKAVAAYGVISRVEAFIMIVVLGMSMSLPPFISQNFGANLLDRVRLGLKLSLRFVLLWQLLLYIIIAIFAPSVSAIFSNDNEVRDIITLVLRILPLSYSFQGMVVLTASSFNALHAPRHALLTSLLRFFILYVPLALTGNYFWGLQGLFIGAAIGNFLAGILVSRWITSYCQQLQSEPNVTSQTE